ncbi:CD109 antigen-like isoform X2 [Mya arenaria]|uniref:CD109 antigen-like isoform X2 n=1 Tax=Mya arenaria TaxID=6604 RepID=UPI0022E43779|nr:CD109 antigen-like isoform X2 [Mya arenaria]
MCMCCQNMKLLLFTIFALWAEQAKAYKQYMAVCPASVRPGLEFTVDFTKLSEIKGDLEVTAAISREDKKGDVVSDTVQLSRLEYRAKLVLSLPVSLPDGEYTMTLTGNSGDLELFRNSSSLQYMEKGFSIFIQTDKAIYKPGQLVQFRAFSTLPSLDTLDQNMNIFIYDPHENRIGQWLNVSGDQGVYQGSLQLADRLPLGDWTIQVDIAYRSEKKTFTVAEYVLPKFEVTVTVPSYGLTSDTYLTGSVQAKYTFGKGVEGNGTLTVSKQMPYWFYLRPPGDKQIFLHKFKINGDYQFQIPMEQLSEALGGVQNGETYTLFAEVEEGLTENIRNGSADIRLFKRDEKMVFLEGASNFKPGLPYSAYAFVSDQDDKPLSTKSAQVNVTITMYYTTKIPTLAPPTPGLGVPELEPQLPKRFPPVPQPTAAPSQTHVIGPEMVNVPRNGIVPISFTSPGYISRVEIQAVYKKIVQTKYLDQFHSSSGTYIQASLRTSKPKAGKRCTFRVEATEKRIVVNFMIVSKNIVVTSGKFNMRTTRKRLRVMMTSEMAPLSRLIVYYVKHDAEVIADSVMFDVDGLLKNQVDIDYMVRGRRIKRGKPGNDVTITVKADAGSLCNVLTVDKSVLLLKSGNDITFNQLEEEVESYDTVRPSPCLGFICLRHFYPVPTTGSDVTQIFQNSGLMVITDAFLYSWRQLYYYRGGMPEPMMMMMKNEAEVLDDDQADSPSNPRVRTKFPETWIFESAVANSRGEAKMEATIPDTITSWVASAFAVHRKSGLGIVPKTATLEAFLRFFVRLDLPYSVVRGEQVILQADVFNYFSTAIEVKVTLKKSNGFSNIMVERDNEGVSGLEFVQKDIVHKITVAPGGGVAVRFPIKATSVGTFDVEIRAVSSRAGDGVRKPLLVVPEGVSRSYARSMLIQLRNASTFEEEVDIIVPEDAVADSVHIAVSLIGDMMGPTINGVADLLQMPYGCGEQNMITLVPNIVVVKYLEAIEALTPALLNKAKGYMMVGYQQELTYKHDDNSFSAFGNSDPSGSTWLTAFVIKSFAQASAYIYVDPGVITRAIDWVLDQYEEGKATFNEPGKVIHTAMMGRSSTSQRNLNAYVLTCLLEAKENGFSGSNKTFFNDVIDSALDKLWKYVDDMKDSYELAISGYAFLLDKRKTQLEKIWVKLQNKRIEEGGMVHWSSGAASPVPADPLPHRAGTSDIETTAYVLFLYTGKGKVADGLMVVKWLTKQRNPFGGFGSTQDTVVALQALSGMAAMLHAPDLNMTVAVTVRPSRYGEVFKINKENALVMQTMKAPSDSNRISFDARGDGIALAQISVSYNVMMVKTEPKFELSLKFTDETMNGFKLALCFRWLGTGSSGMALLELGLLSGFEPGAFSITDLTIFKRVETIKNKQNYYFDEVPSDEESCFKVEMQRVGLVAGSQPGVVSLSDYYEPSNAVTVMYQPALLGNATVCDLDREFGC